MDKTNNYSEFAKKSNIYNFCRPFLDTTNLNGLEFCRIYNDTSRIHLATSSAWLDFFYSHKLYLSAKLQRHPDCYQSGAYLWLHWNRTCPSYQNCGKLAADYFNFDNGISIVRKTADHCNVVNLVAMRDDYAANEFYIHNLDLIHRYIDYFLSDPVGIIAKAEKQRFYLSLAKQHDFYNEYADLNNGLIMNRADQSSILKLRLKQLTSREKQCIHLLAQGLTVPAIATQLQLSARTVEKYVSSLKRKFSCKSLFKLGSITNELQTSIKLAAFIDNLLNYS